MNLTCIICPVGCSMTVGKHENQWVVNGNRCNRGREFAINEATDPRRSLCSTVKTTNPDMPRLPVRTDGEIPRDLIFQIMELINNTEISHPVGSGDVVIKNVFDTGVNIISTCDMH